MAQTSIDPNFKNELAAHPGAERVLNCFLCGTCTAGCPVSELSDEYNPRRMMRQILAGEREALLVGDEIWKCNQCHVCVAHCPQDVRFADVVRAMREMAVEKGARDAEMAAQAAAAERELNRQKLDRMNELLKDAIAKEGKSQ